MGREISRPGRTDLPWEEKKREEKKGERGARISEGASGRRPV